MAKTDIQRSQMYALISALKVVADTKKSPIGASSDAYKDQLESTNGIIKKSVTDFTSKIKGGTQNKKDIFEEIINIANSFLGTEKEDPINAKTKPLVQTKLMKYAKEAARKTLQTSRQTVNNEVKKSFFGGSGMCNSSTTMGSESYDIAPKEFDFVNMLKVSPDSTTGKLIYESTIPNAAQDIKYNRTLYEIFDSMTSYYFVPKDGGTLFRITWDTAQQKYHVDELASGYRIGDFLDNYYNSIEFPDIDHVLKTAMQMVLGGDKPESPTLKLGFKNLNRLLTKLFSLCGKPATDQPLLNTTDTELTEDETDIQDYFNFDDIEGIDLDDEDGFIRGVLKFRDCNNFETELNPNYPEDFAYLLDKKPIDENIINTLNKAARDAYETAESGVAFEGFQISLYLSYILKIPRALIASILSPKMFYPIVLSYKIIKGGVMTVNEMMKTLYSLFFNMIKALFWNFIKNFWSFIKRDLLNFIKSVANQILQNMTKKIRAIIQILINIIKKVLSIAQIGSCTDIFNAILQTIKAALNTRLKIPMPGMLMMLSEYLPGYSSDRAYINIVQRAQAAGIEMGPIYGSENKLPALIKSIMDGHSEEMDTNSYVQIALKGGIIPAGVAAAVIPPGIISGYGKVM